MNNKHIRIDDEVWDKAKARAAREGTTVSAVLREFATAYANEKPYRSTRLTIGSRT